MTPAFVHVELPTTQEHIIRRPTTGIDPHWNPGVAPTGNSRGEHAEPYREVGCEYFCAVTLIVEFDGDRWEVDPGRELTFGRAGDVCMDEANLHLHRIVGTFRHRNGHWWLHNLSSWIELDVRSGAGSRHTMAPNARLAVIADLEIRFSAGRAKYAIGVSPVEQPRHPQPVQVDTDAPSTNRFGEVSLNDEQRLLLAALCEPRLIGADGGLPSNRQVANRLGWRITKFNRKLDYLCKRFDEEGVAGLRAAAGGRASTRRETLVDHVLATGLITVSDLELLE